MSTRVEVVVPRVITAPRGARWFGRLVDVVQSFVRAARETARANARARDAAWVRSYADQIAARDPGMAADLRAAVDRSFG